MTSGGDFLSYSSLHPTEVVIDYDCAEHPEQYYKKQPIIYERFCNECTISIGDQTKGLAWMALALPVLSKDAHREFPDILTTPSHYSISETF